MVKGNKGMTESDGKEREMQTKGKTFAACPAPSSLSREQEIMEMYKCKERGRLTDREEEGERRRESK